MQLKYLKDIKDKFNLPVLQVPMMQDEMKGINRLKMAVTQLFTQTNKGTCVFTEGAGGNK